MKQPKPRTGITLDAATPEANFQAFARMATSSSFAAMRVLCTTEQENVAKKLDLPILMQTLRDQAQAVHGGDLAQAEAMLMNQATALQSLFARLVERGMVQDHMPNIEGFMRLALRAQAQCTRTLEVLAGVKNPPVVFAKQANIAQQQQVNNNGPAIPTRAREAETTPIQLLEELPSERLDTGTPATTSGADSHLETVGTVHRPEVGNG